MLKKIESTVFNVFYFKIALMVMLIPTLLVYCVEYNYKLLMVMLVWGAVACLYDFFVRRTFVKVRGMLWIGGFLLVFLLSVLLNFRTGFSLNITSWGYSAIALFLLYPDGVTKDRPTALRELSVINTIFIAMTAVLSTVSLGMFVTLYSETVQFGDQSYSIGWAKNRLFGVYANTGYMITAIGLAVIAIEWAVLRAKNGKVSVSAKVFLIYTAAVNFLSMCMENAKGAFFSLAAFCAVGAFFLLLHWLSVQGKKAWLSALSALLAAVLSVAVLFGLISVMRPALSYVPVLYEQAVSQNAEETLPPEETQTEESQQPAAPTEPSSPLQGVDIDRNIDESYGFFTGRTVIWKFGLEEFLKKPLLGYGPQSHRTAFVVDDYLRHFHNLIVQTLVSVGSIGSVLIFGFFVTIFWFLFKKLFAQVPATGRAFPVSALLMAFMAMLLVNSMAEVTILFITRFAMFMFWIYLGYLTALLSDGEQTRGTKFLQKISGSVDKRLGKKAL